jgi:hypothetical protein
MSTVHWVTSLEGHDLGPTKLVEVEAKFSRRIAKTNIIVVHEPVNGFDLAADVVVSRSLEEVLDGWVIWVTAKHLLGLLLLVWLVNVVHSHDSQVSIITRITERDSLARLDSQLVNLLFLEIQADGNGEEVAVREPVLLNHAIVVLLVHESLKRREATIEDEFDVTELAFVENDSW